MSKTLPPWLKKKFIINNNYLLTKNILQKYHLHTVCENASCPNIWQCYNQNCVTFMILGDICTRGCAFCGVGKGPPLPPDRNEAANIVKAVSALDLKYVVITSVTRDDLADGGAFYFYKAVENLKKNNKDILIEILIPDFKGDELSLKKVFDSKADIFGHNMETVKSLYPKIRPQACYDLSLNVIRQAKSCGCTTKSALMLGLGEKKKEISETLQDLKKAGCDIVVLGQYLQPSVNQTPVSRYIPPEEFNLLKKEAESLGFKAVLSEPFARSSYHAEEIQKHSANV
jgi:lipoic acid synthetase